MKRWIASRIPATTLIVLLLLASAGAVLRSAPDTPPADAKPATAKPAATKKVRVLAKEIVSKKEEGKIRVTTFTTARILQDDATFNADTIVDRSEDDVHVFTCTGNPVFTDPANRITADKVVAFSTPRRAEFTGTVKMVSTPKKKEKSKGEFQDKLSGEPTTVTCDAMSYDYAGKRSQAKGSVVVVQKHRTLWADEGVYDQKVELITLRGNVRMLNTGEEELKEMKDADTVTISLEDDWIDIVAKEGGLVELTFDVKDDDGNKPEKPAPAEKK